MGYSKSFKDHFQHPRNAGAVSNPDVEGRHGKPGQGNYMIITLKIHENAISEIGFETYGLESLHPQITFCVGTHAGTNHCK